MSYLVLARKARPQTFKDVLGQRITVKTLQNSLKRNRVAHAILFSGVRGVGKTTLARIMAKALNCENRVGNEPCNECDSCVAITSGSSIDLTEIDGASNRGIQEIRELKEKLRFLPTTSEYKIIIIDEVHMLTTEAFNALLKTLEEPPKHVHFMFATTELHKIPITILSRCQRYELQRISQSDLTDHFMNLAENEGYEVDQDGMALIVREAEGSVRDGLSLLDQIFSYGEKKIHVDDVIQVLGLVDRQVLTTIMRALLESDSASALKTLDACFDHGIDLNRFTADLLSCFRNLLISKMKNCSELLDLPQQEIDYFQELSSQFSVETIHMKLNLLMEIVEGLRYSNQPRLALETGFLKIIEASNVVPVSTVLAKLDHLLHAEEGREDSIADKKKSSIPAITENQPSLSISRNNPESETVSQPKEAVPTPSDDDWEPEKTEQELSITAEQEPSPKLPIKPQPHQRDVRKNWNDFIGYVKERKNWMAMDLQRAEQVREDSDSILLHYDEPAICKLLREQSELLTEFALDFFQKELKVRFILPNLEDDDQNNNLDNPKKQRQLLANDPLVVLTAEVFNGQVSDIRIGPRFRQP